MQPVDLMVYPDECDAFGHLNQASFLSLFERARWESVSRGPGIDVFTRHGCLPAVRKSTIEYLAPALPGDLLRFHSQLTHRGRTSFVLRQSATRVRDDILIALAEFVFVCIDREGAPVAVPDAVGRVLEGPGDRVGGGDRIMVNGVDLVVEVRGDGPALLFIHGFPLDRTLWHPVAEWLDGRRCIVPDLRGMGRSDAPDLGYSMGVYATDLAALLDVLGEPRATLVGLSMGGYVAFEFFRRYPERVAALILMDSKAEADSAEARQSRDALAARTRERGARAVADAMLPKLLGREAASRPELVAQVRAMIEGTSVRGIVGALGAMRDRRDNTDLLERLGAVPVLALAGEDDAITPAQQMRAMASAIPGARFQVIPGAGHLPPLEQPKDVLRHIKEFLGGG